MSTESRFYVGTYVDDSSQKAIYQCSLNRSTNEIVRERGTSGIPNPSFLAVSPDRRTLYAVSESGPREEGTEGEIFAFGVEPDTGTLTTLGAVGSCGVGPCHVTVEPRGEFLFATNYVGGTVAMIALESDGLLREASHCEELAGSGPNPERQEAPHPHSTCVDPSGRFVFVPDLGTDKVRLYEIDRNGAALRPAETPEISVPGGAGPRHMVLHSSGKTAYVANELDGTVSQLAIDLERGSGETVRTIPALPEDAGEEHATADIHFGPEERYLYISNRDQSSIACFSVDPQTHQLELLGQVGSGGERPRNFAVDPTGSYILAANLDSDWIALFEIDPETGSPVETGNGVEVPKPVCVRFL